ncbi:rho-related GTP-binding protein RhoN-like [Hippocampus comes]|uniref:rho-related GTP-binding protein RhoN-like n=1 Tax=Hippocampus comes TaxID=109280 RepID=UPI00094EF247|nr:PREDICTED: rho-related GTP-binding protein RhoN-like [Hippocampus comes]
MRGQGYVSGFTRVQLGLHSLKLVIEALTYGYIKPWIHRDNSSSLCKLILQPYHQKIEHVSLTDLTPIQMLLEMGLDKMRKDYFNYLIGSKVVLVGCKLDLRTDVNIMRELSKHRLIPVTHEQGTHLARQIGAAAYAECTSKYSENSVRDVFHVTTLASVTRGPRPAPKRAGSRRGLRRVSQQPPRTDVHERPPAIRKARAKSCVLM